MNVAIKFQCVFIIFAGSVAVSSLAAEPAKQTEIQNHVEDLNDSVSRAKLVQLAAGIDRIVEKQLKEKNEQPNPPASDETFVRRIYLDIIGRIPTRNEALEFLSSESAAKRGELIDKLLNSEGYVSHQFNYFADLLRIQERSNRSIGRPYIDFVKDSLRENKHYDDFVFELLTSSGPMMKKGNGATGYYMRDLGMPEDNMSNTVRIFLGTRLECAQCHDHPFDKWTQRDYYEMVAFNGGISNRLSGRDNEKLQELNALAKKKSDPEIRKNLSRLIEPLTLGVSGKGTGLWRLPEDFLGGDGDPNQVVPAKTMFEKESLVEVNLPSDNRKSNKSRRPIPKNLQSSVIPGAVEVDSRQAFAKWVTSAKNPRFATVIANRFWKRAFGIGVIEPVDEMTDDTNPSNPELMEYLSKLMVYLYMNGGMSHLDTFDPKPGAETQGPVEAIETSASGVRISQYFPKLAKQMHNVAVINSLSSTQGAHAQGQYFMHTAYTLRGTIRHPDMGAWCSYLLGKANPSLPANIKIGGSSSGLGGGFLESSHAALPIGDPNQGLAFSKLPEGISEEQFNRRLIRAKKMNEKFLESYNEKQVRAYAGMYDEAVKLMRSSDLEAFNLEEEEDETRDRYGRHSFGQGCLLARRLVEKGTRFVEVNYGGWDTHQDNFGRLAEQCPTLDSALSSLLADLEASGLLKTTLVVLATEFGRSPRIVTDRENGRNHYPQAFSCLLAGGGVKGGFKYGATDKEGREVEDDMVEVPDFNATIGYALSLPLDQEVLSPSKRPFTVADKGQPIKKLFA